MATRVRCQIAECHQIKFTAAAALSKNDYHVVEDAVGFVAEDVAAGADGILLVKIPRVQVDKTAVAVNAGDRVFRDSTAEQFTNVSTGRCRGFCNEDVAASAATVEIFFDGALFGS